MATKPYLIFRLHDTRYAIAAEKAREIFLLPELIPVADAPSDIVGLLNLHSTFVPVMHLDLRFGHRFDSCNLNDNVIVLESQGLQIGVVVHQVETVNDVDDRYIQEDLDYGRSRNINRAFIKGVINLDDEIIMLLDEDNLVRHGDDIETLVETEADSELPATNFYEQYFPIASPQAKEILHQRAANLGKANTDSEANEVISLAIVRIDGDYFGLDLAIVREFTKIERVTAIPCCPERIIGNMNLRGEILTLIDIRQPLNLTVKSDRSLNKAVVVEVNDIVAGIAVEEVLDVVDFSPEELKPIPAAIDPNTARYFKGMANYLNRPLNAIDLPKLLAQGAITVKLAA